jgi:hypothetical protein
MLRYVESLFDLLRRRRGTAPLAIAFASLVPARNDSVIRTIRRTSVRAGKHGTWTRAVPVEEFNSLVDDARPNVRSDGLEIVFDSSRQGGAPNIWSAVRSSVCERWPEPVPLGEAVNSEAAETRASLSWDGTRLYFGSTRSGGQGNSDIHVAKTVPPRQSKPADEYGQMRREFSLVGNDIQQRRRSGGRRRR